MKAMIFLLSLIFASAVYAADEDPNAELTPAKKYALATDDKDGDGCTDPKYTNDKDKQDDDKFDQIRKAAEQRRGSDGTK